MCRIRQLSVLLVICWVALLPLGFFGQGPGESDRFKQTILDAEAVQTSADYFPILEDERNALNWFLDSLTTLLGYQRNSLPVVLAPVTPVLRPKVEGVMEQLIVHMKLCKTLLRDFPKDRTPDRFAEAFTVLSAHPGCYYLGLDTDPLCNHRLAMEMNVLQIQDYPFVEAAEGDPCLWEIPENAPHLTQVVAFGCDIDDATFAKMHLDQLPDLAVLALDENLLSEVPLLLFKTGKLRSITLYRNQIRYLPADLKPLSGLVYLDLRGNPISEEEQARIKKGLSNTMVVFK